MPAVVKRYLTASAILMSFGIFSLLIFFSFSWSFRLPRVLGFIFPVVVIIGLPAITYFSITRYRLIWWFPPVVYLISVLLVSLADQISADSSITLFILLGVVSLILTVPAALAARNSSRLG